MPEPMKRAETVPSLESSSTRVGWILIVGYFLSLTIAYCLPTGKEVVFYPIFLLFFLMAFPRTFHIALRELDLIRLPKSLFKDLAFTCCILALNELIGTLFFLCIGNAGGYDASAEPPVTVGLILSGLVLAPIVEETIFRGLLWRTLGQYGQLFALLTTSILFVLMHGAGTPFIIVMLGVSAGLVMSRTDNLIYPILMHMIHNSGLLLPTVADGGKVEFLIPVIANLGLLLLSFCILKRDFTQEKLVKSLYDPSLSKKLSLFFKTSGVLLYMLIFGGQLIMAIMSPQ